MTQHDLSRRRFLLGGAALGAGALLAACTSNDAGATTPRPRPTDADSEPERRTRARRSIIGFSAPAADHGWIAAITNNAKAQAAAYSDVEFKTVEAGADAAAQRAALATLIAQKPDVIVLLPHDGKELNAVRPRGDGGRHPGGQPGPGVPGRAGLPAADQGRQLRHGRRRRQLHRRAAEGQGRQPTRSSARSPAWTRWS